MGMPAAKMGDQVRGIDVHIVLVPTPAGPVRTPTPLPFNGLITSGCATNVMISGRQAAVVGSIAVNVPPHVPKPSSGSFQTPPTNQGTVLKGSATVLIGGKPAARHGDIVMTCNDPAPAPTGTIVVPSGTVLIGG